MKHCAKLIVCAGILVLSAAANAASAATADAGNPYADTIVGRNVFSLKTPPPPPNPEDLVKKDPPPKILLQGLTTILGRPQVLFKVQIPAKPGQPAKEESFVMTEGERQGEIEVLDIDESAGEVKFNNHGTVEPLNMKDHVAKAPASASPMALPQPGRPTIPGVPPPTAAVNPNASGPSVVTTFGSSREIPTTRSLRTASNVSGVPAGTMADGQTPQTILPPLSREEQEIMIEVNRQRYLDEGNPHARVMPPTSITPKQNPSPQ